MAKRTGFQYRQPRSKMPRLDITISSSQSMPSRVSSANNAGSSNAMNYNDREADGDELWGGDDDEEFILLASQAAEKIEANAENFIVSQAMNFDLSYGQFQKEVQASTQLDDIFDNDDIFSNIPDDAWQAGPSTSKPTTNRNDGPATFKVPGAAATSAALAARHDEETRQTQLAKNEAQQSFFTEKIKAQKKELENLRETLNKVTEKCETKEGEASTLRYELELNRQQCDKMRKDKVTEIMQLEKQFSEKIVTLEKTIEAQQSELEFKNIEMMQKRSKKSLNDSVMVVEPDAPAEEHLYNLFRSNLRMYDGNEPSVIKKTASHFLTEKCSETYQRLSEKDFEMLSNLNVLQSLYNASQLTSEPSLDDDSTAQMLMIAANLIDTLRNYSDRLDMPAPCKYNPTVEYKALQETMKRRADTALPTEKLVYERQILAVIALFCSEYEHIVESLLFERLDKIQPHLDDKKPTAHCNDNQPAPNIANQSVLDIVNQSVLNIANRSVPNVVHVEADGSVSFIEALIGVLHRIGCSKSVERYRGLIESSSILLVSLAQNYTPSEKGDPLIRDLFKAIAFCEPNLPSLCHLSQFLVLISTGDRIGCCNNLCANETSHVTSYARYRINRFSYETCPLQIFACLTQVAIEPLSTPITPVQQEYLCKITIRIMRFLRNCFNRPVDWLFRKTCPGTINTETTSNTTEQIRISHCYCYTVNCTIVLLHMCIKEWVEDHSRIDANQIESIFKLGTFFLFDNFHKHFEPKVLQIGGFAIKNRLQVVYDWIVWYSNIFSFQPCHDHAIKAVNLRRLPLLNEPQMVTTERAENDDTHRAVDPPCPILMETFDKFFK